MSRFKWTNEAENLLLFCVSKKVTHQACAEILRVKIQEPRTVVAIRSKLKELRVATPHLYDVEQSSWRVDQIDARLQANGASIELDDEMMEIARKVCQFEKLKRQLTLTEVSRQLVSSGDVRNADR